MKKNRFIILVSASFFLIILSCLSTTKQDGTEKKQKQAAYSPQLIKEYNQAVKDLDVKIGIEEYIFDKEQIIRKVAELDNIILNADFEKWKEYISPESVTYWSTRKNLNMLSRMYAAKGVGFASFKEYFTEYVVRSRLESHPDEIRYINPKYVKVVEIKGAKDIIFYEFVKNAQREWLIRLRTLNDR
ncbi:MAG: hypothetical protein ACRC4W_02680 [Treponemataceae bacterium]